MSRQSAVRGRFADAKPRRGRAVCE